MRKFLGLFILLFSLGSQALAADSLYSQFEGKIVKVKFGELKNTSTESGISTDLLRDKLAAILKSRHSITFEIAKETDSPDLIIDVNVRGFLWTDKDPVDMLMGLGGTAFDAATIEDFARIEAYVVVKDAKRDHILWQDLVLASVTKKGMSREDSLPLVAEDLAKNFVKECFKKKRQ